MRMMEKTCRISCVMFGQPSLVSHSRYRHSMCAFTWLTSHSKPKSRRVPTSRREGSQTAIAKLKARLARIGVRCMYFSLRRSLSRTSMYWEKSSRRSNTFFRLRRLNILLDCCMNMTMMSNMRYSGKKWILIAAVRITTCTLSDETMLMVSSRSDRLRDRIIVAARNTCSASCVYFPGNEDSTDSMLGESRGGGAVLKKWQE
mmetsp:Transcript_19129/g.41228  ORF Transcript_19129/g.41228 Transcript_19129/m.41228 type:complete len:202 (-) Transcript_19129:22-627(-)